MNNSNFSLIRSWILSVALIGAPLATGHAAPLIDANFNGMTAGQQVATGAPPATLGGTLQTATTVSLNPDATAKIYSSFKSTNAPNTPFGQGNSLVIERHGGASALVAFDAAPVNAITSGIVSFSFDFMVDNRSDPARTGNFFIGLRNSAYTTVSSLQLGSNGALTLVGYASPGSAGTVSTTSLGTLSLATAYTIELRLNFETGMAQAYINGTEAGTLQPFATTGGIMGATFSTASNAIGQWGIDNLRVEVIPEPSVMALLTVGGIFGFRRMVRRNRSKVIA